MFVRFPWTASQKFYLKRNILDSKLKMKRCIQKNNKQQNIVL